MTDKPNSPITSLKGLLPYLRPHRPLLALWLTAVLYALFAVLSVVGWRVWQRRLHEQARG